MTDTPTAPTLRELLESASVREHSGVNVPPLVLSYPVTPYELAQVESRLLAPLRKEIATLQNQFEQGRVIIDRLGRDVEACESDRATLNARIRILHNHIALRDREIARLRRKVAAADRFREHAGNFVLNATVSDPYLSEQWGYLTAAYDATKTEEDASAPPTNEELDRNLVDAFIEIERQEDQLAALRRDVDWVIAKTRSSGDEANRRLDDLESRLAARDADQ